MLHVDLPPVGKGGVAYQVDLLASTLSGRGHDVTVFVTHPPGDRPYRAVELATPFGGRLRRHVGTSVAFSRIDLSDFDVVHAHGDDWALPRRQRRVRTFYGTALMEARTATSRGRRYAQALHYGLEWVSSARATELVAISRHTQRLLPLAQHCIPCGFDPASFFPDGERTDVPSILFVAGVLRGRKRGELMLRAFQAVRRALPATRLHVVSRDRVSAPGVVSHQLLSATELGALYRTSWLLCSTSSYEGLGVPYLEAMGSGLPVVATHNAGAHELLQDGAIGIVCEPDELPARLVDLLEDDERRRRYAAAGLEAAVRYAAPVVAERYERLYEQVASGSDRRTWPQRGGTG